MRRLHNGIECLEKLRDGVFLGIVGNWALDTLGRVGIAAADQRRNQHVLKI